MKLMPSMHPAVEALSICCLSCLALVNMLDPGAVCQDEADR